MDACLCMANISSEENAETMSEEVNLVIESLVKQIKVGSDAIGSSINDEKNKRVKVDFEDDNNQNGWITEEVTPIYVNFGCYNIVELLNSLYYISVNDSKKYTIFKEYNMSKILEVIILNGNCIEKEYALKVLWQLAFDDKVASDIKNNKILFEKIESICDTEYGNGTISHNANGIIWLINKKLIDPEQNILDNLNDFDDSSESENSETVVDINNFWDQPIYSKPSKLQHENCEDTLFNKNIGSTWSDPIYSIPISRAKNDEITDSKKTEEQNKKKKKYRHYHRHSIPNSNSETYIESNTATPLMEKGKNIELPNRKSEKKKFGHIMISYNRDNRDLCLKIKNDLISKGYEVWIDVEKISGSSLESMAEAIENSECVLICMTEKYKVSSYSKKKN
jgi:hypothetical protein